MRAAKVNRDNNFGGRWAIAFKFAAGLAMSLVLCRIGWIVLATSIADHAWRNDAKATLAWLPTSSAALLSMAETIFVRATRPIRGERNASVLFKPKKESEFNLDFNASDDVQNANVLWNRAGRPIIGDVESVTRWIDLLASRNHYARATERVASDLRNERNWRSLLQANGRYRSPVAAWHVEEHPDTGRLEDDLRTARALAQMSLVSDPLQSRALILLSDIAARLGDSVRSHSLVRVASGRSRRDVVSQTRAVELQISRSDFPAAIATADAMLRLGGVIRYQFLEFLTSAVMDDRAHSAMSEFLVTEPSWRHSVFERIGYYRDPDSGVRLLSKLASGGHALFATDLAPVLQVLIAQGRTTEAYLSWTQFLSETRKTKAKLVFDGGFTENPTNIPFEWNVTEVPKGSVAFLRRPDPEGTRTLRIEFVGSGRPRLSVYQVLSLSPGRYRLKVEASADNLRTARGVVWRLSCFEERENVLAETEPLRGSISWRELSVDFVMPEDGCDFPVLRLALGAKAAPELIANGTVYFRNLRLLRRPATVAGSNATEQKAVELIAGNGLRLTKESEDAK